MKGLECTEENRTLRKDLRKIKKQLNHKETDNNNNAILLFKALNSFIEQHQQAAALIPIIIHFKENILKDFDQEINSLQKANEELQNLFANFLESTKQFNIPVNEEEEKRIYNIFMKRIKLRGLIQAAGLSSAQRRLKIVVNNQEYPKLLRINGNAALKYMRKLVYKPEVDLQKLAELLHNIRHLILNFANPEFQSQLSETTLFDISRPCGNHLVSLYLNGCQDLSLNNVFSNLTKIHPNLQILHIRNLPKLTNVGKIIGNFNFPNLTDLYLINCPELNSFEIHAPNLRKLQVINCPNLYKLTTQRNAKQDIGINNYAIEDCPKLITKFNLPLSCFIELLADYTDFQASDVDANESVKKMSTEANRGNYNLMFFENCRKVNKQEQGEARLANFDQHLEKTIGISNKYLRDYVTLILIQGAGEDILGRARDLSFAYAASRLICQKLNEVIRPYVKTAGDKLITGISNLIPKIKHNVEEESVCLEFADSLSIYEDNDKRTQLGFARYSITVYADRSKLPEFICNLDLYNSITVTIAKQKIRPIEIFNPNNIRSLFENAFTALNNKDFLDEEMLSRAEQIAQLMPCYAALHAKLFPTLAVSKYGTQNARFAILYLINWLIDLTTKSLPIDTTVKQIDLDRVNDFANTFGESFAVEDHTIRLNSEADRYFIAGNNSGIIPKIVTDGFFILHQDNQSGPIFN